MRRRSVKLPALGSRKAVAQRYEVEKRDLFDESEGQGSVAVRLAQGLYLTQA